MIADDDGHDDDINDDFAISSGLRKAGDPAAVHDAWLDGVSKRNRRREVEMKRCHDALDVVASAANMLSRRGNLGGHARVADAAELVLARDGR
jgi:hypothetical protein